MKAIGDQVIELCCDFSDEASGQVAVVKIAAMRQEDFNELFRQRTKTLSLEIIRIVSELKYSDALNVIRKQLFKSVTSVAANFLEQFAEQDRTKKDIQSFVLLLKRRMKLYSG